MSEHLLERGKAIRWGKGNREGVTKIDEGSSRKEKGRWEKGLLSYLDVTTKVFTAAEE